jgi:hypothetical protein
MTRNLREEVDIAPYVERGVIDVSDPAARDNINTLLTGALGPCFLTPYIALEKVRKVLAYYHIFLSKTTFLEGDRGVEVFTVNQFGELSGMKNSGEVVTKVDSPLSLYFEYKMNDKGMYDIFSEIVTQEELDDLVDNVENEVNDEDAEDDREEKLNESLGKGMKNFKKWYTIGNDTKSGDPREIKKRLQASDPKFIEKIANQTKKLSGAAELQRRMAKKIRDIKEDSESVKMAGPETGPKQYPGGPELNALVPSIISKVKMKKKLEEDTKERDDAWEQILNKKNKQSKSTEENPNPTRVKHFLDKLTGNKSMKVVKEEDKKKVY